MPVAVITKSMPTRAMAVQRANEYVGLREVPDDWCCALIDFLCSFPGGQDRCPVTILPLMTQSNISVLLHIGC